MTYLVAIYYCLEMTGFINWKYKTCLFVTLGLKMEFDSVLNGKVVGLHFWGDIKTLV